MGAHYEDGFQNVCWTKYVVFAAERSYDYRLFPPSPPFPRQLSPPLVWTITYSWVGGTIQEIHHEIHGKENIVTHPTGLFTVNTQGFSQKYKPTIQVVHEVKHCCSVEKYCLMLYGVRRCYTMSHNLMIFFSDNLSN